MRENNSIVGISKLDKGVVRCSVDFYDDGDKYEILVYNIAPTEKEDVVNLVADVMNNERLEDDEKVNKIYKHLLHKYTSLAIDVEDVSSLLIDSKHPLVVILNEINTMIYECQYEMAVKEYLEIKKMSIARIVDETFREVNKMNNVIRQNEIKAKSYNRQQRIRSRRKFVK